MIGRLISFEGGEGSGKSTQAERLACALGAVLTREPGGTAAGERVRQLLLDPDLAISDRAEALLMAAARAQHVAEVIRPALDAGRDVVTDRYVHSSLAYQGYGRGLDLDEVRRLSVWATGDLWPDVVVLMNVPAEESLARRQAVAHAPDRLEAEDAAFHGRVAEGFRALAAADPDRWLVVDGVGSVDDVAVRVRVAFDGWAGRP
jgi:dTMP kinase